jgi:hypothetical protein
LITCCFSGGIGLDRKFVVAEGFARISFFRQPLVCARTLHLFTGAAKEPEYKGLDRSARGAGIHTDLIGFSVGTDPGTALRTRKGTGFCKVPSLKGVWYRGRYGHDGSVTSLVEWFNPARLKSDYMPNGWTSRTGKAGHFVRFKVGASTANHFLTALPRGSEGYRWVKSRSFTPVPVHPKP